MLRKKTRNVVMAFQLGHIRRSWGALFVSLLLAPMSCVQAFAEDGDVLTGWTDEGYQIRIKVVSETEKTAEIYGNVEMRGGMGYIVPAISMDISGVVTVPAQTEGYKIISLGGWAFSNCSKVTEIKLPEGLQSIQHDAFSSCSRLEKINIPSTVNEISTSMTFWFCYGLTSISVAEGNSHFDSRDNCNAIIQKEGNVLILGCANTIIPEGIEEIGTEAFCGCSNLTSIVLPSSLKIIGTEAFRKTNLSCITIPDGVTTIGRWAFRECEKLSQVKIGENLHSIEECAFYSCYELADINFPSNIEYIGSEAFRYCRKLQDFELPSKLTKIEYSTFSGCNSLTKVYIHNNIDSIGDGAFSSCENLEELVLGKGLTTIQAAAFSECDKLKSVTCYQATPLEMTYHFFGSTTYNNAVLYVPRGSRNLYAATSLWGKFQRIMEFDPAARVSVVTSADGLGAIAIGGVYEIGSVVMLSATTESGWIFNGWWSDDTLVSSETDYPLTITEDSTIIAKFEKDPSGISDTRGENVTPTSYYNLDGKRMDAPRVGVNIMKMSDGTARKVYVK